MNYLPVPKSQSSPNTPKEAASKKKTFPFGCKPLNEIWEDSPLLVTQVNCFQLCHGGWPCPFTRCSITGSGQDLTVPIQVEYGDLDRTASSSPGGTSHSKMQHLLHQVLDKFYPKRYKKNIAPEQLK